MALYVLAVLCALYCVGIGLFVGFGSYFFLIWGVIAAFCAAWGWILTINPCGEDPALDPDDVLRAGGS